MGLVLTRVIGETIHIGDHIIVKVIQIRGKQVRLHIEAPKALPVHRTEVYNALKEFELLAAKKVTNG